MFGATANPFGASTTTTTAPSPFSFGSTAPAGPSSSFGGFGAPAPTASFGAPSTTPSFGGFGATTSAPSTTQFGFGAQPGTTSSTGFGAPSTTTPSFGFGATAPTSTFGTSAPATGLGAPSSTGSGFSFGATTPAPSTTQFGFGAQPGTTSSTGFGAPSSATPNFGFGGTAPSSFGFGTSTTPATGFGTTPSASSTFGFPSTSFGTTGSFPSMSTQPTLPGVGIKAPAVTPSQLIESVKNAYNPNSNECRFRHMMYNVVDDATTYGRPANVPERLWQQALDANPDPKRLVPVQALGFQDLKKRIDEQDRATMEHQKALDDVQRFINALQRKHELDTTIKIEQYRRRHLELAHRVLTVMKKVEVLRNKGYAITFEEESYRSKMETLLRELNQPTLFRARLNELVALVRMQEDKPPEVYEQLDDDSLESIHNFLTQQTTGLSHLMDFMKKDIRDVNIMVEQLHRLESQQ